MEDEKETFDDYYKNISAFSSLSDISTSYNDGLAKSILEMVQEKDDQLYMSDILEKFGSYNSVHHQVKRLLLDNKLILYETSPNSIVNNDYENQRIKVVEQTLSEWLDMAAQPCLTCAHTNECAIENPVSPVTCEEFGVWLQEEIDLEFMYD